MVKRFFSAIFPAKGDTRGEVIRKLISIVAFVVLIFCVWKIAVYYSDSLLNKDKNKHLASVFESAPPSSSAAVSSKYPEGMLSGFYNLYDLNQDVKGFLTIPGTQINNPVVEATDNNYYLEYCFDKKTQDGHGTLFLDFRDIVYPMSQNLIIYGHNMKDGQMFHDLRKYQEIDTYKTSSLITFDTIYGKYQWKVFAAFMANTNPKLGYVFDYLKTSFNTDGDFQSFIKEVQARSLFKTSVDVQPGDDILTLSTCAYELPDGAERLVVMARRVRDGEDLSIGPVTKNRNVLGPTSSMK